MPLPLPFSCPQMVGIHVYTIGFHWHLSHTWSLPYISGNINGICGLIHCCMHTRGIIFNFLFEMILESQEKLQK